MAYDDPEATKWLREKMGGKKGGGRVTTSTNRSVAEQLSELDDTPNADGGRADGGHADGDSRARKR